MQSCQQIFQSSHDTCSSFLCLDNIFLLHFVNFVLKLDAVHYPGFGNENVRYIHLLYNTGMDLFCRYQISGWCILCICRLLSFCSSLHFDFNKEMFNLVSNKLCKMFHLAFGTTSSLFSSKTHTA